VIRSRKRETEKGHSGLTRRKRAEGSCTWESGAGSDFERKGSFLDLKTSNGHSPFIVERGLWKKYGVAYHPRRLSQQWGFDRFFERNRGHQTAMRGGGSGVSEKSQRVDWTMKGDQGRQQQKKREVQTSKGGGGTLFLLRKEERRRRGLQNRTLDWGKNQKWVRVREKLGGLSGYLSSGTDEKEKKERYERLLYPRQNKRMSIVW